MTEVDEVLDAVAAYFRLLAEPTRLKVLHAICDGERSVGDVVKETGLTQTTVSRQLSGLHVRGVVSRRKAGGMVFYRVADATLLELCRTACLRIAGRVEESRPLKRALRKFMPAAARPK